MRAFDHAKRAASDVAFIALTGLLLGSLPAWAVTYPVSGVWAAPHPEFPISSDEACFTVKAVGIGAVLQKSIARIIIFNGTTRYTAKGNIQASHTLRSLNAVDGGYWITELPTESRRFWFRKKITYFMAIVDPRSLEIRENSRMTRFVKCGPRGKLHI